MRFNLDKTLLLSLKSNSTFEKNKKKLNNHKYYLIDYQKKHQ